WSDLIHSLQPNGRASDGVILPDGDRLQPFGIMKESWVSGLFALGAATARYAPAGADPTADLVVWYDAVQAGEPYRAGNPSRAGAAPRRRHRPCDRPEQGERLAADQRRCQRLPGPLRAPREQDAAGQHLLRTRYDLRRDGGRALQGRELDGPGPRPPAPRRR